MIELVFVIVILGVLAAVAVPRFIASRTDAQIASARSDASTMQKQIVAKVFADNIDTAANFAPDPNKKVADQQTGFTTPWGEWILMISGVAGDRWKVGGGNTGVFGQMAQDVGTTFNGTFENRAVEPIGNVIQSNGASGKAGCGAMLGVFNGFMIFAPNNLGQTNKTDIQKGRGDFCDGLKASYQSSGDWGNRIIPLSTSGTIEW